VLPNKRMKLTRASPSRAGGRGGLGGARAGGASGAPALAAYPRCSADAGEGAMGARGRGEIAWRACFERTVGRST
jgi:hypothetical protein